ncbi:MAG: ATP phosphoribosyltransferase [Pseudomonadales bacterium]
MITIALTKGRIMQEALPLLRAAGIEPAEDIESSRKLCFDTTRPGVRLLVLRGADVITYLRHGSADIGVVGKDMLLEEGGEGLYELADLGIARCRLMTAGPAGAPSGSSRRRRVATKYTDTARAWYASQGVQADVIKLYGGMELAPVMGLADEIVDIVDSGKTLVANGLEARECIANISSRLVANKASLKVKHADLMPLVDAIAAAAL